MIGVGQVLFVFLKITSSLRRGFGPVRCEVIGTQ
jgi:hypothetical protein